MLQRKHTRHPQSNRENFFLEFFWMLESVTAEDEMPPVKASDDFRSLERVSSLNSVRDVTRPSRVTRRWGKQQQGRVRYGKAGWQRTLLNLAWPMEEKGGGETGRNNRKKIIETDKFRRFCAAGCRRFNLQEFVVWTLEINFGRKKKGKKKAGMYGKNLGSKRRA